MLLPGCINCFSNCLTIIFVFTSNCNDFKCKLCLILAKMCFFPLALPTVHLKEREKKVLAGQETNVSLICLVDGHPKPNITWTL